VEDQPDEIQAEIMMGFHIEIPGFVIDKRHTVFYGLCKTCAEETAALGR
jgi:Fe2+ or Zn2+ uptake regulation protein